MRIYKSLENQRSLGAGILPLIYGFCVQKNNRPVVQNVIF